MPWGAVAAAATSAVIGGVMAPDGGGTSSADAAQADALRRQQDINDAEYKRFKKLYAPLEKDLVTEARATDSPEEIARVQGEANVDVADAFQRARLGDVERMRSMGINPGSPAWQSSQSSIGLTEAATRVGALKMARDTLRELGFNRRTALANLGRGIPAQVSSSNANIANAWGNISNNMYTRQRQDQMDAAYAIAPVANAVGDWVGKQWDSWTNKGTGSFGGSSGGFGGGAYDWSNYGKARGGLIQLRRRAHRALKKHYALGGAVDVSEVGQLQGPGTETSDSIPAVIDGQQPAALSHNEYVMNAGVMRMSPLEILDAINKAGLSKREGGEEDIEDVEFEHVPLEAAQYNRGGKVKKGKGARC